MAIILLGFSVRLYLCFFSGLANFNTDTEAYYELATGIINGSPTSLFPNGYPLIIAAFSFLAGEANVTSALLIFNIFCSTSTILLVFLLSRRIMTINLSILAAAMIAFMPNQLNYVRQILTEAPSTFFLLLGLYFFGRWEKYFTAISGAILYFCGMIRSTLSPVGFLAAVYLLIAGQRKKAIFLLAGFLMALVANNALEYSNIVKAPSNLGGNLLIAINSDSMGAMNFSSDAFSQEEINHPLATYLKFFHENPIIFLNQRLSSFWELWGPWPSIGDTNSPRSSLTRALIGVRFPLLLLAIVATFLHRRQSTVVIYAIPIILVTAVHVAFFSTPRFTYPVEPLVTILAVLGASDLWQTIMGPPRKNKLAIASAT